MNETIRALRREHDERLAKADELLSKPSPLQADIDEANEHLDRCRQLKAKMDLGDVRGDGSPAGTSLALKSAVHGGPSGFTHLGFTQAGKAVIDVATGQLLEDVGPGTFGRKVWDLISSPEYKRDLTKYIRSKGLVETKALQEGLDDQGGVLVPADWLARIVARKPAPTSLAGLVTNMTTGRDRLIMPRVQYNADDLYVTNFRVTWTGEVPASDSAAYVNDAGLFGNVEIPVFTAMLTCTLTNDMVEDAAFPIQAWLEDQLRLTVELTKENMIVNGTGKGQPTGLLLNPQPARTGQGSNIQYVLSSSAGTFTPDDIRQLPFTIPPQYDNNCRWVFNKNDVAKLMAGFKDSTGRYLFAFGWQDSGMAAPVANTIGGYPYTYCQFMPNHSSTTYPVLFGDPTGYYLVNRLGVTIQVLRETRAKLNQVELVARVRFGGQLVEPWKMTLLKSNNS